MKTATVNLNKKAVKTAGKSYVYWVLRWTGSDGKPRMEHVGRVDGPQKISTRQAKVICARKQQEISDNPNKRDMVRPGRLSVFLSTYLESRRFELSAGTFDLHRQTTKYLHAFFAADPVIDEITKADARAFKTALAAGQLMYVSKKPRTLQPATIDRHMRQAKTIFNQAVDDDLLPRNPFVKLTQSVEVEKAWHFITTDEFSLLMEAAPDINWRVLFALCRMAGLRRAEALNLTWSDIDWQSGIIQVISKENWKTKTRKSRKVPMYSELQSILLEANDQAAEGQNKVVVLGVRDIHKAFEKTRKIAKVDPYSSPFHAMRKSCAQGWANSGVHPNTLRRWLGHSKFETTMRHYLAVPKSEYEKMAESSFFGKSVQKSVQKPIKEDNSKNAGKRICGQIKELR